MPKSEETDGKNKPLSIPPTKNTHSTKPDISSLSINLVSSCQPYCVMNAVDEFPHPSSPGVIRSFWIKSDAEPAVTTVAPILGPESLTTWAWDIEATKIKAIDKMILFII